MSNMGDQRQASGGTVPVAAAGSATGEEIAAAPWEARLWAASCALASLGAALFGLSIWVPWVTVTGYGSSGNGHQQLYRFLLDPADIEGSFGLFGGSLLSVAGLILLPFLWQHRSRVANLLALAGYWTWGILLTVYVTANSRYFHKGSTVSLVPDIKIKSLLLTATSVPGFGYWLHFAALGIVTLAAVLLPVTLIPAAAWARLRAGRRGTRSGPLARVPGRGTLAAGLIIWAIGTFLFPWATLNCTANPLFVASCTGVPFTSALEVSLRDHASTIDPLVAIFAAGLLLGISAIVIFLACWTSRITPSFSVWVALWLVVATGVALAAASGVNLLTADPTAFGLAPGSWSSDDGVVASFLGLLIGWGALLYLVIISAASPPRPHPVGSGQYSGR